MAELKSYAELARTLEDLGIDTTRIPIECFEQFKEKFDRNMPDDTSIEDFAAIVKAEWEKMNNG